MLESDGRTNDVTAIDRGFYLTDVDRGLFLNAWNGGAGVSVGPDYKTPIISSCYGNTGVCRLQMISAQKRGSALLMSWDDPYIRAICDLRSLTAEEQAALAAEDPYYTTNKPSGVGSYGFALERGAKRLEFTPVGRGTFVESAKEYSHRTRQTGDAASEG